MSNAARKHAKFAAVRLNRLNYLNRMAWFNDDGKPVDVAAARHTMVDLFSRWAIRPCERKYQTWMGRKTTRILHPLFCTSFIQDTSRYNDAVISNLASNTQTVDAFALTFTSSTRFVDSTFHNMLLCTVDTAMYHTWRVTIVFTRPTGSLQDLTPIGIRSKKPLIETKENLIPVNATEVKDTKSLINELIRKELQPFLDIADDLRSDRYNLHNRIQDLQQEMHAVQFKIDENRIKMEEAQAALLGDWLPK